MKLLIVVVALTFVATESKPEWDYMIFSQEWPPSTCLTRKCIYSSRDFNIHGLWPTIYPRKQISACQSGAPKFNISALVEIRAQLDVDWSDLFERNPKKFWKHEWDKHGTCAYEDDLIKQEKDYFKIGLDLKKRFDTLNHLIAAGFKPKNGTQFTSLQVQDGLSAKYGKQVLLACRPAKNGVRYLTEVRLCISADLTLIDCPSNPPSKSAEGYDAHRKLLTTLDIQIPVEWVKNSVLNLRQMAQDNVDFFKQNLLNKLGYKIDKVSPWTPIDFGSSNCGDYLYIPEY